MYFPKLDKIVWFLKKYETYFILLFLVIIGTSLWKFDYLTQFTGEWASCVDYIKEGILYQGQPKCYHGPVNFFISYYLIEFFPNSFLKIYELIVLISSLLIFLLVYKIIKKLNLKHYYILLSILFFTLIYIPPLNNNSGDSVYSTLLMLLGFYILYFSKNIYYKYLASSFLFTLSIFTRVSVLIPIVLISIYYFISNFFTIKDKKISIEYPGLIKTGIIMSIIPITTLIILRIIFPNIIAYTILTQLIVEKFSLLVKIKEFVSGISLLTQLTFLILAFSIPLYWFRKKRNVYSFIALFGLILITYGTLRGHHGYFHRYYLPLFPFLIIAIIEILNNIKSQYKKLLFILLILIFSLSSLKISDPYFTSLEFRELRNILDGSFKFLPNLEGRILADNDYFLEFSKNIDQKKVDIIPNKYGVDGLGAQRIETLGLLSPEWKNWREKLVFSTSQSNEILTIGKKIIDDEYSIIVIGAFGGSFGIASPIMQILGTYSQYHFNKTIDKLSLIEDFKIPCEINFPSLINPCPDCGYYQKILFTNLTKENCENIVVNLYIYYNLHIDEICSLDQNAIDFDSAPNFKCSSDKHILKKLYERKIATFKELLLILSIMFIVLFYYYFKTKKESKEL